MKRHLWDTRLGQVHGIVAGPEDGTPLLLLHQTPRSVDEFAEVIPLFARTRRVIALDMPGYGSSDPVPGRPRIEDYAAAFVDVLDALGVARVVVVGHHTGGVIGVELAAGWPDRVERVVISGPVYMDAAGRAELAPFFKQWTIAADGSHFADKWGKFLNWMPRPEVVQRYMVDVFRAGTASEQGHYAVIDYRMDERIGRLRCPALLMYCRTDPFASPDRAAPLRAAFRPGTEVTIEGGIFALQENPEGYARAVLDYLATG